MIARDRIAVADWTEYKPVFHPYHDPGFLLLTYGREFVSGARQRLPQSRWLPAAFGAHSRFRPLAEHFLESYSAAWGRSTGSEVRSYLPLVMAHYACYGQQAQYWTEACEIWSTNPELFFG